jgi:Transferrin receptor-like dimerisation domain/Peptidase family M28/PA domain
MEKDMQRYEHLPIPSYEEATSSRPGSSLSRLGPQEISDDAERQGLLFDAQDGDDARVNYEPPTVESARPSIDSLDALDDDGEHTVRAEMEQMDVEDPNSDNGSHRSLLTYRFSKRFTTFTNSLPTLRFPSIRRWIPTVSMPHINFEQLDTNRVVILGRLFGIFLIVGVIYILVASDILSFSRNRTTMGQMFPPESIRIYIQENMNKFDNIQDTLGQHILQYPHMAGTEGNYVLGEWVAELFKAAELEEVGMEQFDVYLNYPTKDGRRVAIVEPEDKRWEATLEENHEKTFVFHGHSKNGNVTGPLIYANYGSREDFAKLKESGIDVTGAVVLVRYYGTQGDRALKVKAAEMAGAVGCIIYSDPVDDGMVKGPTWPNGRYMPEDGVQRGAVSLMSWVVGDVLSPGWASTPEEEKRLAPEESPGLVQIPSIPISWRDAKPLLQAIQGHGKVFKDGWQGIPRFSYWTGDQTSPIVNLANMQDEVYRQPIYNVLGQIRGWEQPDKKIIVGNHRDAWCYGAADPGSGTAVMLEVVRIFGELKKLGWRPLRTIEFASWDGEEYNLIGSTEHVENRLEDMRTNGFAYLNVDMAVTGVDFHAAGSPLLERPLLQILGRVSDPITNKTVREDWEEAKRSLEGLGAGSDYVAFQDIAGTSSLDMSFRGQRYPYHSCYDNFEWMSRFGDSTWTKHKAMGEIWALLIFELADRPVLPYDMEGYANAVGRYVDDLDEYARQHAHKRNSDNPKLDLVPLHLAAQTFKDQATIFHRWDEAWSQFVYGTGGFESNTMAIKRMSHNDRMANFETHLLDLEEGGGLPGRTQFKHVIFAPQAWSAYDEAFFPSIRDAIDANDWTAAEQQVKKVARILTKAALKLNGN